MHPLERKLYMLKYIIFSDLHGDKLSLMKIKNLAKQANGVFFAGDGYSAVKSLDENELYAVGGNCDIGGAPEMVIEIDGARILLTHGHKYGVKSSLLALTLRAKELDCTAVIFGHTHQPFCSYENDVFLLNPGASSGYGRKTYALMTIDNGNIKADVLELK